MHIQRNDSLSCLIHMFYLPPNVIYIRIYIYIYICITSTTVIASASAVLNLAPQKMSSLIPLSIIRSIINLAKTT